MVYLAGRRPETTRWSGGAVERWICGGVEAVRTTDRKGIWEWEHGMAGMGIQEAERGREARGLMYETEAGGR